MFHTTRNIQGVTLRRERPEDPTRFGYTTPPVDESLNRTIQKWLQSLKLTINVTSARRYMQNGFVCAQIFNRYYPVRRAAPCFAPRPPRPPPATHSSSERVLLPHQPAV